MEIIITLYLLIGFIILFKFRDVVFKICETTLTVGIGKFIFLFVIVVLWLPVWLWGFIVTIKRRKKPPLDL